MKLATLNDGSPDGELLVVAKDLRSAVSARAVARTLQEALEQWEAVAPRLKNLAAKLENGTAQSCLALDHRSLMAPLPRAWQWLDGSAFKSHGDLMSTIFKLEKLSYAERPLMYQGMSHKFLAAHEDVPMMSEADGIDFEGEFGVLTDFVPMGTTAEQANAHIRLFILINDWSLRVLAPIEMKTGFGWIQAKPPCSMGPIAVTPDELCGAWTDGRVALPLEVTWNQQPFGHPNGRDMSFSFPQLVAHAAHTRDLCAGTVIGSGTVSNESYREVGSTCIAERRGIEILDHGKATTAFMQFGDEVTMRVRLPDNSSVFGDVAQKVVAAKRPNQSP